MSSSTKDWHEWQRPYEHGLFIIRPPAQVRRIVDQQRQQYDPGSQTFIDTHITLTHPLLHPLDNACWEQFTTITSAFGAFKIEYGPVEIWSSIPVVYYQIRPTQTILEVRQALHQTGHFNLSLPHTYDFVPHMTILEGSVPLDQAIDIQHRLNDQGTRGSFGCNAITLVRPNPDFHFEVVRELSFHNQTMQN